MAHTQGAGSPLLCGHVRELRRQGPCQYPQAACDPPHLDSGVTRPRLQPVVAASRWSEQQAGRAAHWTPARGVHVNEHTAPGGSLASQKSCWEKRPCSHGTWTVTLRSCPVSPGRLAHGRRSEGWECRQGAAAAHPSQGPGKGRLCLLEAATKAEGRSRPPLRTPSTAAGLPARQAPLAHHRRPAVQREHHTSSRRV